MATLDLNATRQSMAVRIKVAFGPEGLEGKSLKEISDKITNLAVYNHTPLLAVACHVAEVFGKTDILESIIQRHQERGPFYSYTNFKT